MSSFDKGFLCGFIGCFLLILAVGFFHDTKHDIEQPISQEYLDQQMYLNSLDGCEDEIKCLEIQNNEEMR